MSKFEEDLGKAMTGFLENGDLLLAEYRDAFVHIEMVKVYDQHMPLRFEVRAKGQDGFEIKNFGLSTEQMLQALGCFKGLVQDAADF